MKIFNWIFSSFFRTFGRFLFYIAVGLLALMLFNGKAHALTYNLEVGNATYYLCTPTGCGTKTGKTDYLHDSSSLTYNQAFYKFSVPFQTISSDSPDLNPGLFPGQYLIEFYVFSNNGIMNTNYCYQLSSNFKNINMTTGNLVSDEINSSCVDIYRTTYLGVNAYRILYKFDYTGDYATEFVFDLNSSPNDFFSASPNIGVFGISLGNISTYSTDLVDAFKNDKNSQTITSQNQQVIEQNQTIINQNTQTNEKLDETNEQLGDLNENLTSTEGADLGALENSAGWLPAGPVDSILNLPLSLLNNLTNNLSKSCQPVILSIPYVIKDLTLPCVNTLYEDMGISGWVTTIGVIASAFIMFSYLLKLYKWVDDTLSFRENNQIDNWGGI